MDKYKALLIVFDYNTKDDLKYMEPPPALLSMYLDLTRAYNLLTQTLHIPRSDITIITDVIYPSFISPPWGVLSQDLDNPRLVNLEYPDICIIVEEIINFVYKDNKDEAFIYVSCHGAKIGLERNEEGKIIDVDNALTLQLLNSKSQVIERRYLKDNVIYNLFCDYLPSEIDIYKRIDTGRAYEYIPVDKMSLDLTKVIRDNPLSSVVFIFDTCHSGTMLDLDYSYNPESKTMELNRGNNKRNTTSINCVCIAATSDNDEAISSSQGSLFSKCVFDILGSYSSLNIIKFYTLLCKSLPPSILSKKPLITSNINNAEYIIPLQQYKHKGDCDIIPVKPYIPVIQLLNIKGNTQIYQIIS